jgi:hypothetical protein
LDQAASKGRSDDCGTLREAAIGYIPPVEGIPTLDRKANKELRGFCHHATARMLCPRSMRDEFDKDWEKFSRDVQNGKLLITEDGLPSFLYPETAYNSDALDENLLRGPFLLSVSQPIFCMCITDPCKCYRHVFTGPRTAMKATKGKSPGKRCVADIYKMTEVTPTTIAYIAVIVSCRFVFNACIFLIDTSSAATSSVQRRPGVQRTGISTPRNSFRISWFYLTTNAGQRKR